MVARNAWKGGTRQVLRELAQALGQQRAALSEFDLLATDHQKLSVIRGLPIA